MTANDRDFAFDITMPIRIRKLQRDDLPKLEWHGEFTHYRKVFLRTYKEQRKGNRIMLVADCQDFPVGRLFIQFRSISGNLADGETKGYIYSFHVMAMFRGQGIGTRMLQVAEVILKRRSFQLVTIAVAKDNFGALRLYQRYGYTIYGQHEGRWQYRDHNNDLRAVHEPAWLMKKELL